MKTIYSTGKVTHCHLTVSFNSQTYNFVNGITKRRALRQILSEFDVQLLMIDEMTEELRLCESYVYLPLITSYGTLMEFK